MPTSGLASTMAGRYLPISTKWRMVVAKTDSTSGTFHPIARFDNMMLAWSGAAKRDW